ncbi:MAG: Hpt domain-containing protein [Gemmatimonadales bacterium]|nr:Hpt domain-containing protein [Gemmatimonadales bacterium]
MSTEFFAPGPEIPVIDESRLISEFGEDAEILAELRDLFLQHVPPLYNSILEAVANGDALKLAQDAHSLKGACATFGAPRLAMVCQEFEKFGKAEDTETALGNLALLTEEYESVFSSIGSVGAIK